MNKVRKAVIPAAGLGTRFLPATKAIPKEMLPLVDIPTIQVIVQEALDSGIEEILIISNSKKTALEHHFGRDLAFEEHLRQTGKNELADQLKAIGTMANITFIYQENPKGLGDAVLYAEKFAAGEPFAVLLGDDVVVNRNGKPALLQLIEAFDKVGGSVLGVQTVPEQDVCKYGIVTPSKEGEVLPRLTQIIDMVEKPKVTEAPSRLAVLGRYVFTNDIFKYLKVTPIGKGGEVQLTDGIRLLNKKQKVYAYDFMGERYDVGDKFGFVKATIDFALDRADLKDKVEAYLKVLTKRIK